MVNIIEVEDNLLLRCSSEIVVMDHDETPDSSKQLPLSGKSKPSINEALLLLSDDRQYQLAKEQALPNWLDNISTLIHLSVFGILGVLTRYLLQILFGPNGVGVTTDHTILYLDLPSNMVGSFLMGWFGIVFKDDISQVSDHLAVGLSTGYLGSLTTFSGWNQKMIDLSVEGHWVLSILGFLVGFFLAAYSIIFGIETANGFRSLLNSTSKRRVGNRRCYLLVTAILLVMLIGLLSVSGTLLDKEFQINNGEPQLWLACIVAPLGVWIRWLLARLNRCGLGSAGILKWIPFGTLTANVSAACVMAGLSNLKEQVNTRSCNIVATGIQFGLLGCLSTVSTFIAEFNSMRESKQTWRAYAYVFITIGISFVLGILINVMPLWTN
ncbi:hypothetical protein ACFE04_025415 [Oxalis oulophora]